MEVYDGFVPPTEEVPVDDTPSSKVVEAPCLSDASDEDLPFNIAEVPLDELTAALPTNPAPSGPRVTSQATRTQDPHDPVFEFLLTLEESSPSEVASFLERVQLLLPNLVEPKARHPFSELVEVLAFAAAVDDNPRFYYENIDARLWSSHVRAQLETIRETLAAGQVLEVSPSAAFANLELVATRRQLLSPARELVKAIERQAPLSELEKLARRIQVKERDNGGDEDADLVRTALEWDQHAKTRNATMDRIRLSTGWPHLDLTQTKEGDIPGFFSPGHLAGFVAPSGHGKSTFVRELIRNLAIDLRNWGMPNAKVLSVIVEEEPERVVEATRLAKEFAPVGDQVLIAKVNSSRQRFGEAFLKTVAQAVIDSEAAGQPVREFMPAVVLLDYLQELVEQNEGAYTEAIDRTTGLLRGIAECDLDEVEKFSRVRWADVAPSGMRWPSGLDDHRIAVIATAQIKGIDEKGLYYKEGDPIDDFVFRDPVSNEPLWQVKPGDHRLIGRGDVAGSKRFLNNLSMLVFMHRSNVRASTEPYTRPLPGGRTMESFRTVDARARFYFEKQRYGASSPVVPMAFSSSPDGRAAKWYDYRAEAEVFVELDSGQAVERSWWWDWDPEWVDFEAGGPILPVRPRRHPATKITY